MYAFIDYILGMNEKSIFCLPFSPELIWMNAFKQTQIWWAADKVFLIWLGDLRTLGWVTGSAAKVSYERIMWHWEHFHTTEYIKTL